MIRTLIFLFLFTAINTYAQNGYKDSIENYQQQYILEHEVVKGDDKSKIQFFPVDENFKVNAKVERLLEDSWEPIPTSSGKNKLIRKYAKLIFEINGRKEILFAYQLKKLLTDIESEEHLFLPFTDGTTGEESYETGRYLDLKVSDIKNGKLIIDFNKCYNPYCAYVSGVYSCPVPPEENRLKITIRAGEKKYQKQN